ncbi:tyrosine-type recombinase/integrase [Methylobacterium sp. P31]
MRLTEDDHVYAQADDAPVQPNSPTHEFTRILGQGRALPRMRFHDLRHSHAMQMLANEVHPKIAQERLKHSCIPSSTLDLYSNVLLGMQEDASAKVDAALRWAIDRAAGCNGSKAVAKAVSGLLCYTKKT